MKKKTEKTREILSQKISGVLVIYAKTQLVLMTIVTLLTWFVLARIGVQFAFLLALMTGSAAIVPVLGLTVSAVIAALVAMADPIRFLPNASVIVEGVVVVIWYGVLNVIIDYVLAPYLIGKSTGIHPVILLALVLFGTWSFGLLGALFTVPAVLVFKTVFEHSREK